MEKENFNDLFEKKEYPDVKKEFNKDEWKQRKNQERSDVFNMLEEATNEIAQSPDAFINYLNIQSIFDRYSVGNCLLIAKQNPNAIKLNDYDGWKEKGVQVQKGESAILILEPGQEYSKENGSVGVNMNVKRLFDISQTSSANEEVSLHTHPIRSLLKALMEQSPVDIRIAEDLRECVTGAYSKDENCILIRKDLSGDDIFKTLAFEIITLNDNEKGESNSYLANVTSYVLCRRYGLNTESFNFSNCAEYFKNKSPKEIRTDLDKVRSTANSMSNTIEQSFERIQRARHQNRANTRE